MRRRALLLGLVTAACGKSRRPPPPISWLDDDERAFAEAMRRDLPLFVFAYATYDCATKEYERVTFVDADVMSLLHADFVPLRVDVTDDEDARVQRLVRRFDVRGVPTLTVVDPRRGHSLWWCNSYLRPRELAPALCDARARYRATHLATRRA